MGDRLTEEDQTPKQTSPTPYGDIFDEHLPHYMAIGMTYDQYWDGEVGMKTAFRNAFRIRTENEQKLIDRNNWYMGQYIMDALHATPLLVGGLNVKPSTQLPKFPDKPYLEQAELRKKEEAQQKLQEDQTKLAMALFQAGIMKFNKRFQQEQVQSDAVGTGQ